MSTKAKWENQILTFYDSALDYEHVLPLAPIQYYDDFLGADAAIPAGGSEESGCEWSKKVVKTAGTVTVAGKADAANGTIECALDNTSEEQEAMLYMGDQRLFKITQGLVFETRVALTTLPTLVAEAVFGLVGDYAKGPDNITYSIFFTADGSGAIVCEADDNATDSSQASGVTVTAGQWKVYRIDCRDVTDIKYYINGARVASSATIPYAATGANAVLQPYFGLYKASGAGVGKLEVDYVRIWMKRS